MNKNKLLIATTILSNLLLNAHAEAVLVVSAGKGMYVNGVLVPGSEGGKTVTFPNGLSSSTQSSRGSYAGSSKSSYVAPQKFQEVIDRVAATASTAVSSERRVINNRIARKAAVASGDAKIDYGVWVEGVAGAANQKQIKDYTGYKSRFNGFVLGADAEFNDKYMLGISAGRINSNVKDKLSGKSKSSMNLFTVYGSLEVAKNLSISTLLDYSTGKTKITKLVNKAENLYSHSKPKVKNLGGQINIEYSHNLGNQVSIIPNAGFEYDITNIAAHSDGVIDIKKRKTSRGAVFAGLKLQKAIAVNSGMTVTPSVNLGVNHAVKDNKGLAKISFAGQNQFVELKKNDNLTGKPGKTQYIMGAGVNIAGNSKYDLEAKFDYVKGKKYSGHTASLKLRINF